MQTEKTLARRTLVFCAVLVAHGGAILFLAFGLQERETGNEKNRVASTVFFYVDSPPTSKPPVSNKRIRRKSILQRPAERSSPTEELPNKSHESVVTDSTAIDWESFNDSTVRDAISREEVRADTNKFPAVKRASIPSPRAAERDDFPWDKNKGRRTGFTAEGLPYVSLSKKCAIVMFFVVCGFGGEIKPEGELFSKLAEKKDKIRERELP